MLQDDIEIEKDKFYFPNLIITHPGEYSESLAGRNTGEKSPK